MRASHGRDRVDIYRPGELVHDSDVSALSVRHQMDGHGADQFRDGSTRGHDFRVMV